MSLLKSVALSAVCLTFLFGEARAFCASPTAPEPPSSFMKPHKPSVPFCINQYDNTHTCDDWQIQSYNADVDRYNRDVEDYIRKLKYYVAEVDRFTSDAVSYAKCEASGL